MSPGGGDLGDRDGRPVLGKQFLGDASALRGLDLAAEGWGGRGGPREFSGLSAWRCRGLPGAQLLEAVMSVIPSPSLPLAPAPHVAFLGRIRGCLMPSPLGVLASLSVSVCLPSRHPHPLLAGRCPTGKGLRSWVPTWCARLLWAPPARSPVCSLHRPGSFPGTACPPVLLRSSLE